MVWLVYVFFMLVAGAAMVALTGSDIGINLSAATVIGSTPEAVASAKAVAIGMPLASIALGAISFLVTKNFWAQFGIWTGVVFVSIVSATFTIQGVSVDLASNDQSGAIQGARQDGNGKKIAAYEKEIASLEEGRKKREKSCSKYDRWYTCNQANNRIAELTNLIADASDDNVESEKSEQVDITESVYEKTGIPGWLFERFIILSRALAINFVIALMTHVFFHLLTTLFGELERKKQVGGSQRNGSALASFLENLMNGKEKEVSKPKPSNDLVPGMSDSIAKEYFPHLLDENVVDIKSGKSTPKTTPKSTPKKKHTSKQTSPKPRGSKDRGGAVVGEVKLPRNIDKAITDKELRYKLVEYLVRREVIKPTYAQIGRLGIGSDYVKHYVEKLDKNGIIKRGGKGSRSVVYDHKKLGEHQKIAKYETLIKRAA